MKVAFYGSSVLSSYWNGAATYYRGLLKALATHGYEITFFEPDAYDRQQNRDLEPPEWTEVVVYDANRASVEHVMWQAALADVVVKASGVGVFDDLLMEMLPRYARPDAVKIFWDVDAPATLEQVRKDHAAQFRSALCLYDSVLVYGGSEPVRRAYRAIGAKECVAIYNGLDPQTHFPVKANPKFHCDLAFMANRLPDREERVDEFFLLPAERSQKNFLLGGSGWQTRSLPDSVTYIGHVSVSDHNAVNCSALAVLNVSRESMALTGFSPATRVFEAAGAAACLITDEWEGVETFFKPGEEILVARDGQDVLEILDKLTSRQAREIGHAALTRATKDHSYMRRAEELQAILKRLQYQAMGICAG